MTPGSLLRKIPLIRACCQIHRFFLPKSCEISVMMTCGAGGTTMRSHSRLLVFFVLVTVQRKSL